ncbi:Glycoside hydrolase [Phytophthora palmivora]|uniref:Glycoside hydrolase n=1 Tax=Phytophthora palmivora TaxID=4796 RepID=A0A2P4YEY9_9STRA|nr:Glycoside hydrolase [Phytophthora palmivora]
MVGTRRQRLSWHANRSVLPLCTNASVFLTGHAADDIGLQCGGWNIEWQGYSGRNELYSVRSIVKENIESITGNSSRLSYFNALNYTSKYSEADLATAKEHASRLSSPLLSLVKVHTPKKNSHIDDLALPAGEI